MADDLLHREWGFYVKLNNASWRRESFFELYRIKTIGDMWRILNNVPEAFSGVTNIFFMEGGLIPLWEEERALWSKGGCWSTIVKGTHWMQAMNQICMVVMGETVFDDQEVKGICVVPVSLNHCIVKVWTTVKSHHVGSQLQMALKSLNCCQPRFKAF